MNKQRKFLIGAALVGIVSIFLPWITVSAGAFGFSMSESRNGFRGLGIFYFFLLLGVLAICWMGDQVSMLKKNQRLYVMGIGILGLLCLFLVYNGASDSTRGSYGMANAKIGFGLILSFLATLVIIALPILIKEGGESLAGDLSNFKESLKSFQGQVTSTVAASSKPAKTESNTVAELEKLINWRHEGKISQEEYEELKSKII